MLTRAQLHYVSPTIDFRDPTKRSLHYGILGEQGKQLRKGSGKHVSSLGTTRQNWTLYDIAGDNAEELDRRAGQQIP